MAPSGPVGRLELPLLMIDYSYGEEFAVLYPLLRANNVILSSIWKLLLLITNDHSLSIVMFQFVFSHGGLVRNENADEAANAALANGVLLYDECANIPLKTFKAHLKIPRITMASGEK